MFYVTMLSCQNILNYKILKWVVQTKICTSKNDGIIVLYSQLTFLFLHSCLRGWYKKSQTCPEHPDMKDV